MSLLLFHSVEFCLLHCVFGWLVGGCCRRSRYFQNAKNFGRRIKMNVVYAARQKETNEYLCTRARRTTVRIIYYTHCAATRPKTFISMFRKHTELHIRNEFLCARIRFVLLFRFSSILRLMFLSRTPETFIHNNNNNNNNKLHMYLPITKIIFALFLWPMQLVSFYLRFIFWRCGSTIPVWHESTDT